MAKCVGDSSIWREINCHYRVVTNNRESEMATKNWVMRSIPKVFVQAVDCFFILRRTGKNKAQISLYNFSTNCVCVPITLCRRIQHCSRDIRMTAWVRRLTHVLAFKYQVQARWPPEEISCHRGLNFSSKSSSNLSWVLRTRASYVRASAYFPVL